MLELDSYVVDKGNETVEITIDELFNIPQLSSDPSIRCCFNSPDDLSAFLAYANQANLIHFTGHGHFDEAHPENSGLVFRAGILKPKDLAVPLDGIPLVFSNACETGQLSSSVEGSRASWVGVAASFHTDGAMNYLGSLWPIYGKRSRRFAGIFYRQLLAGCTVGEALRQARQDAYARKDPIWAAYALFGCPRNRLRASTRGS